MKVNAFYKNNFKKIKDGMNGIIPSLFL